MKSPIMKIIFFLFTFTLHNLSMAKTYVVKFKEKAEPEILKTFKGKWTLFTHYHSDYFQNLYNYEVNSTLAQNEINRLKSLSITDTIEDIITVTSSSIDPAPISTSKSKDPFYIYQWGLDFQNQKVFNEINDLENQLIKGIKTSDINAGNLDNLNAKFKKDIIVAIIDTGVDYNHPDLFNNIYTNDIECIDGKIPFDPVISHDENIYPGDCKGWDFTGKKELGSNRPEDFVGHGTHLAGIISATRNNNIGLSGFSNRIKILPIKVLTNKGESSQAIGTSDRLSKAILYAISMKADVINLSLGWPLSFDREHLKNAVLEAVKQGVTVVAAAGNNDHSEPIMPCGYQGVICVGSSDPDMKISDFSNFGAHVDVLAPGNNILSTFPTANTPLFFDFNGYEIKSGTSQSTPYVSALVASIKGVHPELSENEVKLRVFNSAKTPYISDNKFSNGSIINFKRALEKPGRILKPIFKGFNRVKVDIIDKSFNFEIKLNDFGTNIEDGIITIEKQNNVIFNKRIFKLGPTHKKINVSGKLKNLDINFLQKFTLKISYHGLTDIYKFEKRFYLDLVDSIHIKKFEIIGANPKSVTQISTLNQMHHPYDFPFYYTTTENKKGLVVSLFTKKNDKIMNIGTTILPAAKSLLSIHRVDVNNDGKADILVRSLIEVENKGDQLNESSEKSTTIMYSYLNESMNPLFFEKKVIGNKNKIINHSHMHLNFEGVILQDLKNFAFSKVDFGKYGKISIPVYTTYGAQPSSDTNPNPFSQLRRRVFSSKIYFFEPKISEKGVSLTTRTFNTNKFTDSFKKKIGFRPFEQVFVVKFMQQSFSDIKTGKFSLLISHESERKLPHNYTLKVHDLINRKWSLDEIKGQNLNLSDFITERAYDLTKKSQYEHDVTLQIIGYEKSSSLMWEEYTIKENRLNALSIVQKNIFDPLEFPIKTYISGEKTFRFYLTPSRIYLEQRDAENKKTFTFPVHVSSFLPGVLFREQHYPISLFASGENKPAIYVDSTQISSRNIYLITTDEEKMYAPVRFNFNIPENCKALNPVVIDAYKYEYSIQCFNTNGTSEIIYVPLETKRPNLNSKYILN